MDKEIIIAVIGFIGTIGGGIRWLLHVYVKQNEKIEDLRHQNERSTIFIIKDSISDLKKELSNHSKSLNEVKTTLAAYVKKADVAQEDQRAVILSMQTFIDTTIKRMHDLESRIVGLANGMIMIKGGNGKT